MYQWYQSMQPLVWLELKRLDVKIQLESVLALAEVSISWDVFQRSEGSVFLFFVANFDEMRIVVEVKVFILIYLNQSHSIAISICDNVHQTLTGRNFGEKKQAFRNETRPPSWDYWGGFQKSKPLGSTHFGFFFWVQNSAPPTNGISSRPPMTEALKPGPSVTVTGHRHCKKHLPRMGFGYLGPSERGQGWFFQGFRVEKSSGGLLTLEWNEKVAKKKTWSQESWHMFLVQQPWKIGWNHPNHPNHSNRQKWSSSLQRKNALCFRISRFVGVSTYFFCCNLTTKQRAGPT